MSLRNLAAVALAAFVVSSVLAHSPAQAACKKLGFTVNHYGKIGPTADSKRLLDGYIASWTAERGIKKYRKGKKTVSCYKFLDFGFFDEWTCKAVSKVCFRGRIPPDPVTAKNKKKTKKKIAKKKTSKTKKYAKKRKKTKTKVKAKAKSKKKPAA